MTSDINGSVFICAKELADLLGIDYGSLRNMLSDKAANLPPCIRVGKRRKWRLSVVENWISENMENPSRV